MVKLASARDFRTYGPGFTRNRYEYINAGLYLFASVVLTCAFVAQLSAEARSGLVLFLIALGFILIVNLHDLLAHLAGIDFRLPLMAFDLQLAFVEFAVPLVQILGTLLNFIAIFFLFIQEEKGYGYFKLEKHALNMLVAGPALWVVGSINNSCQIYERANGDVQMLQHFVCIPFLMGSLLFLLSAVLNLFQQSAGEREIHHGLDLLCRAWIWIGITGSILLMIGGFINVIKVFKMQQLNGMMRLEKLRGGARDRLTGVREGLRVPLIMEHHHRHTPRNNNNNYHHQQPPADDQTKVSLPLPTPTPYKDVLLRQTES